MVWEQSAFFRVPDGLASRKETETAPGQAFGGFVENSVVSILFCSGVDTVLNDFETILRVNLCFPKLNPNH